MKVGTFMILIILIILGLIIANIIKYRKYKKDMKDLTGNYIHVKTPQGLVLKVQFKKGNLLDTRVGTEEEIRILKKYRHL